MANIITTKELQKVLKGTGISEKHFLAKLSNIKMDEYKSGQEMNKPEEEKEKVVMA